MDVYRFAFPQMSVTIAGEPADDYGWQDAALSGQLQGLQSILIAQARTQETILAQQQAGSIAARAESQRHNAYTPVKGSFSGDKGL